MKYWLYRARWWISQYIYLGPMHLDLEITNKCNHRCITCWHKDGKPKFKKGDMDRKDIYYNLNLCSGWLRSVKFNLRGEPLTNHYDLIHGLLLALQFGYIDRMINTNGTLLTPEIFEELKVAGLTTCIISVDAVHPNIYSILHGVNKKEFDKLQYNLEYIRKNKAGIRVILNYHINPLNYDDVEEFKRLYGKDFKLNIKHTMNREGAQISTFTGKKRKRNCPHMMRRTAVLVNGLQYPCCVCYNEPKDIQIMTHERRKELISEYRRGIYTETCKNCTSADIWKNK